MSRKKLLMIYYARLVSVSCRTLPRKEWQCFFHRVFLLIACKRKRSPWQSTDQITLSLKNAKRRKNTRKSKRCTNGYFISYQASLKFWGFWSILWKLLKLKSRQSRKMCLVEASRKVLKIIREWLAYRERSSPRY